MIFNLLLRSPVYNFPFNGLPRIIIIIETVKNIPELKSNDLEEYFDQILFLNGFSIHSNEAMAKLKISTN